MRQHQSGLEKETCAFYGQLQTVLDTIKSIEVCIMMGYLNAKVGEGAYLDCGIGPYGLGTRNDNGHKLAELCQTNNLILTNTLFCHHRRNRYTCISPDNNTRNQRDYIAVNKQWTSSILDAKSRQVQIATLIIYSVLPRFSEGQGAY